MGISLREIGNRLAVAQYLAEKKAVENGSRSNFFSVLGQLGNAKEKINKTFLNGKFTGELKDYQDREVFGTTAGKLTFIKKQHHIARQQINDQKDQYHKEWDNFQSAIGEFEAFLSDQQKNCLGLENQLKSFGGEKDAINIPKGSKYGSKLSEINSRYNEILEKIGKQNKSITQFNAGLNNVRQNISEKAPTQDQNLSVYQQFDEEMHEKLGQISHEINETFRGAQENTLNTLQSEIDALRTDLQDLKNQQIKDQYALKWDQLREDVGTQEGSLKTLQESCSNLQGQLTSLQDIRNYADQKLQGTEALTKLNEQYNTIADKLQQQQGKMSEIFNKFQTLQESINISQSQLTSADNIDEVELQKQDASILEQFSQIQQEIGHLSEPKLQPEIDQLKTDLNEQLRQKLQQDLDAAKAIFEGCTSSMDSYMSYVQPFYDAPIGYLEKLKSDVHNTEKLEEGVQKLKEAYDQFASNFQSYNQAKNKTQSAINHLESLIGSGNIGGIQESEKAVEQTVTEIRNTFAELDENIQRLTTEYRANVAGILENVLKEVLKRKGQAALPQQLKDLLGWFHQQRPNTERPKTTGYSSWNRLGKM